MGAKQRTEKPQEQISLR